MKNILKIIWFYLFFIFYVLLTLKQRNMYFIAEDKNMACVGVEQRLLGEIYVFNPNEKPKRDYLTFKKFKKLHYPKNK